jgi:hypothetical protein
MPDNHGQSAISSSFQAMKGTWNSSELVEWRIRISSNLAHFQLWELRSVQFAADTTTRKVNCNITQQDDVQSTLRILPSVKDRILTACANPSKQYQTWPRHIYIYRYTHFNPSQHIKMLWCIIPSRAGKSRKRKQCTFYQTLKTKPQSVWHVLKDWQLPIGALVSRKI